MKVSPKKTAPNEMNVHVDKAVEKLASASMLLEKNFIDDAVSRAYYAVFHAIVALLREKSVNLDQHKHAYILNQFRELFIDTEIFSRDMFFKIQQIKQVREQADYSANIKIDKAKAEQLLAETTTVVEMIKNYLQEKT